MTVSLGKAEIEEILPHRDPFLLLDEVVELDPGERVVARKRVREDEWYLTRPLPRATDHARGADRGGHGPDRRGRRAR